MSEELINRLQELKDIAEDEGAENTYEEITILLADYEAGLFI